MSEEVTSEEVTSEEVTSEEVTSEEVTSEEVTSEITQQSQDIAETETNIRWEQIRLRTGDNLAAARELLKDAENVSRWSRVLIDHSADLLRWSQERRGILPPEQENLEQENLEQENLQQENLQQPKTQKFAPSERMASEQATVLRLVDDIDLISSPRIEALLLDLAREPSQVRETVVLDLRAVKFIDNSGLAVLIRGRKMLVNRGQRLAVMLQPGSQPERAFRAMSLKTIIQAIKDLDEL